MAEISDVVRADGIDEVLESLGRPDTRLLAGGTDLLLAYPSDPADSITLIDITGIEELGKISWDDEGVSIGAAVKLADIVDSELLSSRLPLLVRGAVEVAGPPIRSLATIGGNVCNASPSADTIPPLLALDARADYVRGDEAQSVPLTEFFSGPGQTALGSDGLLTSIRVPWPSPSASGVYIKHSPRRAMDLAIVGVAVLLDSSSDGLQARIALGAVAPTPIRAHAAEESLAGSGQLTDAAIRQAARLAEEATSPIDDVRGSARYRRDMVRELVSRGLQMAAQGLREGVEGA